MRLRKSNSFWKKFPVFDEAPAITTFFNENHCSTANFNSAYRKFCSNVSWAKRVFLLLSNFNRFIPLIFKYCYLDYNLCFIQWENIFLLYRAIIFLRKKEYLFFIFNLLFLIYCFKKRNSEGVNHVAIFAWNLNGKLNSILIEQWILENKISSF